LGAVGRGRAGLLALIGAALVVIAGSSTASNSDRDATHALFFGDSLINGTGSAPEGPWEVRTAARELGWQATVDAWGGTGYTTGGARGKPYLHRFQHDGKLRTPYDVIVLEGGTNDARHGSLQQLERRSLEVIDYVHRRQPWARIVLVGGYAPAGVDLDRYRQADVILREVAAQRHLQYVSQLHYSDRVGGFLSRDRYHPSKTGYRAMGQDLADAIRG
jgi:lysophospholipase L1-like esterase